MRVISSRGFSWFPTFGPALRCQHFLFFYNAQSVNSDHRERAQSVCVADCYSIVNVLDLPFPSPLAICR